MKRALHASWLFLSFAFLFSTSIIGQTSPQESDSIVIDVSLIPDEAAESALFTKKILKDWQDEILKPAFQNRTDELTEEFDSLKSTSSFLLRTDLPITFYDGVLQKWELLLEKLGSINNDIKSIEGRLNTDLEDLQKRSDYWDVVINSDEYRNLPGNLRATAKEAQTEIQGLSLALNDTLSWFISLDAEQVGLQLEMQEIISSITQHKNREIGNILSLRVEKSIFSKSDSTGKEVLTLLNRPDVIEYGLSDVRDYIRSQWKGLLLILAVYILVFVLVMFLRKSFAENHTLEAGMREGVYLLRMPFITSLLFAVLFFIYFVPPLPFFLSKVVLILFLFPYFQLFPKLVSQDQRWLLTWLGVAMLIFHSADLIFLGSYSIGITLIVIQLLLLFIAVRLIRQKKLHSGNKPEFVHQFLTGIRWPLFLYTLFGIGTTLSGFMLMARIQVVASIVAVILALALITTVKAFKIIFHLSLKTSTMQSLYVVKEYRKDIEKFTLIAVSVAATLTWFQVVLRNAFILDDVVGFLEEIWNTGRTFGTLDITIGGILEFFLILICSYFVSVLIRIVLKEEILSRMELPRGIPMAISSISFYILVTIGFLLALASIGFDLDKIGILAGALGVGIGFGLQTIITNFISGLILVFERPVTEGDIVLVDGVSGTVTKIGIRSSRIRTWDGSELIMPNSDLITHKVINWTRNEYRRRFIITLYTDTTVTPEEVQRWMSEAASRVPGVIHHPLPTTYFEGIENFSYRFSLYYWLNGDLFDIKSNVQLAVHEELRKNNVALKKAQPIQIESGAEENLPQEDSEPED